MRRVFDVSTSYCSSRASMRWDVVEAVLRVRSPRPRKEELVDRCIRQGSGKEVGLIDWRGNHE